MQFARSQFENDENDILATLIAYDLQSGSYIAGVRNNPIFHLSWSKQIADIISPLIKPDSSIIEVGCGEATTLGGILTHLSCQPKNTYGFDISWSRIYYGYRYLAEINHKARLFVGDLFSIPLMSNSIDIVYSSHSLEPNGGREIEAIAELLRISRRWVVLVEPIYELASAEAQKRMDSHGYVKGLQKAAELCGAKVIKYCLLEHTSNPLNPTGLLLLEKQHINSEQRRDCWSCPITGSPLIEEEDVFIAVDTGLVYPVLRGIPMLRAEHAIVASALKEDGDHRRTG